MKEITVLKEIAVCALFLLASMVPFLPYLNLNVTQTMTEMAYHPEWVVQRLGYAWTGKILAGTQQINSLWFLPISWLYSIPQNPPLSFFLSATLLLFAAMGGMYALLNRIFGKTGHSEFAIPAMGYGLSIYVVTNIGGSLISILWYCLFPLFVWMYLEFVQKKNPLMLLGIGILGALLSGSNITTTLIYQAMTLVTLVFVAWKEGADFAETLKAFAVGSAVQVLLAAFWILPQYFLFIDSQTVEKVLGSEMFYNDRTTILAILRGIPDWGFFGGFKDQQYTHFAQYYNSPEVIVATFAMLAIGLFALAREKDRNIALFAGLILCISSMLTVGFNESLITSGIFKFFFDNFTLFRIFRNTVKFLALFQFAMAILLACWLHSRSWRTNYARMALFLALTGIISWPLIGGNVFNPSISHGSLPSYWTDFADYGKNFSTDDRVLILPNQYFPVFKWDGKRNIFPSELASAVSDAPYYFNVPSKNFRTSEFNDYLFDNYPRYDIAKASRFIGIDYILLRQDSDWEFYGMENPKLVKRHIESLGLRREASFGGMLDLYRLGKPRWIYAADGIEGYQSNWELFTKMGGESDEATAFVSLQETAPFQPKGCKIGDMTDVSPVEKRIRITGEKCALVFLQSYDPQWKAYVSQGKPPGLLEIALGKPVPPERHVMANGFANLWFIGGENGGNTCGSGCDVTLYYYPQIAYTAGMAISAATGLSLVVYAGFWAYGKKTKAREGR